MSLRIGDRERGRDAPQKWSDVLAVLGRRVCALARLAFGFASVSLEFHDLLLRDRARVIRAAVALDVRGPTRRARV